MQLDPAQPPIQRYISLRGLFYIRYRAYSAISGVKSKRIREYFENDYAWQFALPIGLAYVLKGLAPLRLHPFLTGRPAFLNYQFRQDLSFYACISTKMA
jgi:hypothetical protein